MTDQRHEFITHIRAMLEIHQGHVPQEWIDALHNVLDVTQKKEPHGAE